MSSGPDRPSAEPSHSLRGLPRAALVVAALGLAAGLYAVATRSRMGGAAGGAAPPGARPNLILISIDSLRADHLGVYGYDRPTSPQLDALARSGVYFTRAIAQATWTTPSHMSLLTSLVPTTHGIRPADGESLREAGLAHALARDHTTLAEHLRGAGYETGAFTGGGPLAGAFGFSRGFDSYDEQLARLGPTGALRVAAWLDRNRSRPFFLFLHTFEVHEPYTGTAFDATDDGDDTDPEPGGDDDDCPTLEQRRADSVARYDGGILHVDEYLGVLVARLRELELLDDTLIVVTSDHGDEFGDHDPDAYEGAHGHSLYDELLRVPLVIAWSGHLEPRAIGEPVRLIDVVPTLLDLLRVPALPRAQGQSLVPLIRGVSGWVAAPVLSECTLPDAELRSLRTASGHYIQTTRRRPHLEVELADLESPLREEYYDVSSDPDERRDLCPERPEVCRRQRAALVAAVHGALEARLDPPTPVRLPEDALERLRSLGYLGAGPE